MPSRKRNKGRARRAKQAARCSHGKPPPGNNVEVDNMMFEFKVALDNCLEDSPSPYGAYQTLINRMVAKDKRSLDIWFDFEGEDRDYLLLSLLSLGPALLLKEGIVRLKGHPSASSYYTGLAAVVASAYLERNEEDLVMERRFQDLCFGGQREAIKFFYQRVGCKCLAEKFKAVKNNPKISGCDGCGQKAKRTDLLLCSGCRVVQYCDRSCQQKKWGVHRKYCEKVQQNQRAVEASR